MADTFGALTLPAPIPVTVDDPLTDPKLIVIASFCASVLTVELADAWQLRSPGTPVCKHVFAHDPNRRQFNDKHCPALYCWMGESDPQQLADDCTVDRVPLTLLWVFEPTVQARQAIRDPVINGWVKALARALAIGRHPAWRLPIDPDPRSARRGSTLWRWAGLASAKFQRPRSAQFEVQMEDGGPFRPVYQGIQATLLVEEVLERTAQGYGATAEAGLVLSINGADGSPTVQRHLLGAFSPAFSSAFSGGTQGAFGQSFSHAFH